MAFEIARTLHAELDVLVVRKLGVPSQPELGMGAIAECGARVLNPTVIRSARVTGAQIAAVEARERVELERRANAYRSGAAPVDVNGRVIIVVDDGLATGGTARCAIESVRSRGASTVVLAVPVGAPSTLDDFGKLVDEVAYVEAPRDLRSVGEWYRDFSPTSDAEVLELLAATRS